MSPQIGSVCKPLSTLVAPKRPLSSMQAGVVLQEPGPRKGFLTNFTLEVAYMSLHVHGEGGHADVELVTNCAGLGCVC